MTALVLELKQGELMILNGAVIRFKTRARLELTTRARFLFGKQIMAEEDATTPARQLYYTLQRAYIGDDQERPAALAAAQRLISVAREYEDEPGKMALDALTESLRDGAGFDSLKRARRLIRDLPETVSG
ncbi:MAG: flagellar biosynthesis repressor FlbT [Acidocella sp.]|nr:flagellar biosynthesis repressor FlbT [Acidocella sp.]